MTTVDDDPVTRARTATAAGEWQQALELLEPLSDGDALDADALQVLGEARYGAGDLEGAITAFEQAHARALAGGDEGSAGAAATTVAMYLMMDTGLMAPVRAWIRRAEELLGSSGDTPAHAWLAMVSAYQHLMSGDMASTGREAARAVELGTRHGELAPATIGRIAAARVRIFAGEVVDGLAMLDEAAVAVVSGQLDALPTGMAYCELVCAMQGLAQYDRAEEWTRAMEHWGHGAAFGGINGRCRVHRAEVLRLRGSCEDAEEEALHACRELRPWMRREFGWPLTELGTIRLRRGDLDGAEEALLAAHEIGWDPQPALALVHLARGDVAGARASIRDALEHPVAPPSKERPPNTDLWRAPLLDAQVQIGVAAVDLDTAGRALDELVGIADRWSSSGLQAMAAAARGRVALAAGRIDDAVAHLGAAVQDWSTVGAPYETAVARRWLAAAHRAAGDDGRARIEYRSACAAFERIGARLQATRTHAEAEGDPHTPATGGGTTGTGTFRRDGDTWTVALNGQRALVRDLKGLRHLARLLAEPGREFHALDLASVASGHLPSATVHDVERANDDVGPLLDDRARAAYRRRLQEVEEDIEEAEGNNDPERAALARRDRDFLVQELSRAVGLGGRSRLAGSDAERARTTVTRSIRYALARIAEHHRPLADHLEHAVHTGTYCRYDPDPEARITWQL